ncbi:MAG: hypothetical protein ACJZ4L_01470 [Candidatus Poriferisodalaceae bacterium]
MAPFWVNGTVVLVDLVVPVSGSLLFIYVVYRIGLKLMLGFSRPVPSPPPAGELRKVRLTYMCTLCGTEVRMTRSPNTDPEGPRCCMEEMELIRDHDND